MIPEIQYSTCDCIQCLTVLPPFVRIAGYGLNHHTGLPHRNHIHHLGWEVTSSGA
jgi:hypothetical protein